jgi:hypothetical protein
MLLGPSYLSEKITKDNIIVPLLVEVCQTSVTQFILQPLFFFVHLNFLAEFSATWQP